MVKSCCAVGCTYRFQKGDSKRLYRFPADPFRRDRWVAAVRREDRVGGSSKQWKPTIYSYICSDHFVGGAKNDDPLHPAYTPTLFSFTSVEKKRRAASLHRHKRAEKLDHSRLKQDGDGEDNTCEEDAEPSRPGVAAQTELEMQHISMTEADLEAVRNEAEKAKKKTSLLDQHTFEEDDKAVLFYTGLPNFATLMLLFNFLLPHVQCSVRNALTPFQEMIVFLMKLRLNLFMQDLAYRFNISQSTVSRIFCKWLDVAHDKLSWLIKWPEREGLRNSMPEAFRSSFPKCVAIVDCFEISMERSIDFNARASSWSNYKQKNTVKYLIAVTPQGSISFISVGYGGRASDKQITEESGLLDLLLPGDQVLADRGFTVQASAGIRYAEVVMPEFTRGKKQLQGRAVEHSRKVSHVRIHVERVIGLLRQKYVILEGTIPLALLGSGEQDKVDKIVTVCAALCNMCPSVVPQWGD